MSGDAGGPAAGGGPLPGDEPPAGAVAVPAARLPGGAGEASSPVFTLITVAVIAGSAFASLTAVSYERSDLGTAVGLAVVLGTTVLQVGHSFADRLPWLLPLRHLTLGCQAVLTLVPWPGISGAWTDMPGLLAGSCLLLLPGAWAWGAFTAVLVCAGALQYNTGLDLDDLPFTAIATVLTGLVLYGLVRMDTSARVLQRTRMELGRFMVAEERLRFGRDLHDLLGSSLSAIGMKSELLAKRLALEDPTRAAGELAAGELADIKALAVRAQAEMRDLVDGYRTLSLNDELRVAHSILAGAGIRTELHVGPEALPPRLDTTLAYVLREGLTNVLRHSRASRCVIHLRCDDRHVRLVMANDRVGRGTYPPGAPAHGGGVGILSLTARVTELNGELTAGPRPDGWYELTAAIPLPAPTGRRPPPGPTLPGAARTVRSRRGAARRR